MQYILVFGAVFLIMLAVILLFFFLINTTAEDVSGQVRKTFLKEMEVFDDRSIEENEANFFAAELLLEDEEVLECLSEHTFFETAKMLYVPAALLDYKFSLLHEKGELVNSMYIRKADFLKGDLHAYDNDIDYDDI